MMMMIVFVVSMKYLFCNTPHYSDHHHHQDNWHPMHSQMFHNSLPTHCTTARYYDNFHDRDYCCDDDDCHWQYFCGSGIYPQEMIFQRRVLRGRQFCRDGLAEVVVGMEEVVERVERGLSLGGLLLLLMPLSLSTIYYILYIIMSYRTSSNAACFA